MPVETDPSIQAAGIRAREDAMKRSGRLSTILTDQLGATAGPRAPNPEKVMMGSSGVKFGA
jgi:hypothetical protein